MRMRSAARSNSCLHFCEQKKYRRFLYSLLGVASPFSTATPQMGSYDRPLVLLSPEFTCLPPALPAPESAFCKLDAALAHAVTLVALREALPRVGILLDSPDGRRPLGNRRTHGARGADTALAGHLRGAGLRVHRRGFRRAERGLGAQEQPGAEQQCAGGLSGEEQPSHAPHNLQR